MTEPTPTLLTLGGVFLLGAFTDTFGRQLRIPRITLLLCIGLILGPLGFDALSPGGNHKWLSVTADIALVMVGFLLGSHFTFDSIREHGRSVMLFSIAIVAASVLVMIGGLVLLGATLEVALLLAGIATATDPAAIVDVIKETRAKGRFSDTLLGIVAIDDALGLIAFSILLAIAHSLNGATGWEHLLISIWEIGGALLLGGGMGYLMVRIFTLTYLEQCPEHKEMVLMETLGFVLLCGGLAIYLKVSFLLSAMMMGTVVVNMIPRSCLEIFHAIEGISWPFLTLFFIFAGASLQPDSLPQIGLIGFGYVLFRMLGRFVGGWIGGTAARSDPGMRRWMGTALLPQAGIALGMALVAAQNFPHLSEIILPIVIGSTVLFQLIGPLLTRKALIQVGETDKKR